MAAPLRVGLITWGTEGDIRPFFALAHALEARGHQVRLVYVSVEARDLSALARTVKGEVTSVGEAHFRENQQQISNGIRDSMQHASPPTQFEWIVKHLMEPIADELAAKSIAVAEQSDVVVGHALAYAAHIAAQKANVPFAQLALQPVHRSRTYAPAGAKNVASFLNVLLWKLADYVMRRSITPRAEALRSRLSMPAGPHFDASRAGERERIFVAISPALFPRPADWGERLDVTGILARDERPADWQPPRELADFLAKGPPVFASFGSLFTFGEDTAIESVTAFVDAARRADARMIVQCPPAVRAKVSADDRVLFIERAPHAALFPQCSLIVHHGGAGTTHTTVAAGRPSVVVPHAADQFFWGDMLFDRGLAARPLPRPRLAAKPLAQRIRWALERPELRANAESIAAAMAREDGLSYTSDAIERLAREGAGTS